MRTFFLILIVIFLRSIKKTLEQAGDDKYIISKNTELEKVSNWEKVGTYFKSYFTSGAFLKPIYGVYQTAKEGNKEILELEKERNAEFIFDDRENVLILIKNIIETFFIKDSMSSKCIYSNLYLNIIFPENKFIYSYKKLNFILKNNSSYIFLKIKKLLRLTKYR